MLPALADARQCVALASLELPHGRLTHLERAHQVLARFRIGQLLPPHGDELWR